MHALFFERIQVGGECRHKRLAFARDHFGDRARVEHHPADQLHVVVPHSQEPSPAFAADGERLDEDVVECLAGGEAAAELAGLTAEFRVGHRLVGGLKRVDRLNLGLEPPEVAGVGRAEESREEALQAAADTSGAVGDCIPEAFEGFHRCQELWAGGVSRPGRGRGRQRWAAGIRKTRATHDSRGEATQWSRRPATAPVTHRQGARDRARDRRPSNAAAGTSPGACV